MRITFIIPTLAMGGAETQIIHQVNELSKRGIKSQIVTLSNNTPLKTMLADSIELVSLNLKTSTLSLPFIKEHTQALKPLAKSINSFNPNHIISCLASAHFISRRVTPKLKHNPKLWVYHHSTEYAQSPPNTIPKKAFDFWNKQMGKKVDFGHLYISKAVQNDIESNFPARNGHLLYNAIPLKEITEQEVQGSLEKYNLKQNNYVIIPGRLHPVKGHQFFLEVCSDFIKENQIQFVFAGYGSTKTELESIIDKSNLTALATITDKIPNKELLALVKGSKFIVTPSIEEGLGNVAIEGLMLGKTILSSNAGGLPEVIKHNINGYIFEKNNKEELLNSFTKLYNNFRDLEKKTEAQIKDYSQRFTIESQINQLLTIINQ